MSSEQPHRRTPQAPVRLLAVLGGLVMVTVMTLEGSRAAFSATTENRGNRLGVASLNIADDDEGSAMFNVENMAPDVTVQRCINVTYGGSAEADVRLAVESTGTGLAEYLTTSIEVGAGALGGDTFDCAGFESAAVLGQATLADLAIDHGDYGTGLGGFSEATAGSTRSYRVSLRLMDDNDVQGRSATATFRWEARGARS